MRLAGISKDSIRTIPGVRQLLNIKAAHGREIGHFSGMYETREEAFLAAPQAMRSTWNDEALVHSGTSSYASIHVFDWPVIYYLQQLIKEHALNVVTDFGGHVGVKYTAYSQVIDFPAEMRWQVVEVPAVIREAKRSVSVEKRSLRFFENLEDTEPCGALLCSGSLQYLGETVEQLVSRLPGKPQTILLNKVPVSRKKAFFTVERYIKSLAYRIYGPDELDEVRTRMGYTATAKWTIPHRDILVLHSKGVEHVEMVGEAWTLSEAGIN
jgi:putative methyltransferase (TIGR04325 family)